MRQGWVFTHTPVAGGTRVLCILRTGERVLHARVEPASYYTCLSKMLDMAVSRGDGDGIGVILND